MRSKLFLYIIIMVIAIFPFSSCNETEHQDHSGETTTYTCPMHPQIIQEKPGTCPICGMDLVVFDRSGKDESLTLHESQVALANITTAVFGESTEDGSLGEIQGSRLNGRLAIDPANIIMVSSRVPGRIEALYFKEPGVTVKKGERLYKIYSEELSVLQQEYLISAAQLEQFPYDEQFRKIERSARQKLELYGQTKIQIDELVSTGKTDPYTYFSSPVTGVVAELSITEGQYVNEGSDILRIEAYDELWVVLDLYPSEVNQLQEGQEVMVVAGGLPPRKMKISFVNPDLSSGSQVLQARGTIKNVNNLLQPGMHAVIIVPGKKAPLSGHLPVGAVIRDGTGTHVWVETSERKYEPRMVVTGSENANSVQIISGLDEGDRVVLTGAYLLYSEYVLKKGRDPMASHGH